MWLWQLLQSPWHMWLLFTHFQVLCNSFSCASLPWTEYKCAPTTGEFTSTAEGAVLSGFGKDPGAVAVYYLCFERKIFPLLSFVSSCVLIKCADFLFSRPPLPISISCLSKCCPLGAKVGVNWSFPGLVLAFSCSEPRYSAEEFTMSYMARSNSGLWGSLHFSLDHRRKEYINFNFMACIKCWG